MLVILFPFSSSSFSFPGPAAAIAEAPLRDFFGRGEDGGLEMDFSPPPSNGRKNLRGKDRIGLWNCCSSSKPLHPFFPILRSGERG